jgi:hypothetical protein
MSEDVQAVSDETPPPDVVERPARSSGVYKLCMACGQNRDRRRYRAGSSICERCEALEAGLLHEEADAGQLEAEADVSAGPAVEPLAHVAGSPQALQWVRGYCAPVADDEALTLEMIAQTFRRVLDDRAQMIGRVTRQRGLMGEVRPEDVPLETAAQALFLACDPILQEALSAATELLGLSLNQVMLGNLAFSRQELLNQDQSLVPQASLAVQYGRGRGVLTQGSPGLTNLPGGRLLDSQGLLIKTCLCCGREFHPPRERPNPDFCDEACGTFADQLRLWATNTVLDQVRYPDTAVVASQPDPRTFWPVERCQESYITHALQFREQRIAVQMEQAHLQQQKMRGL